MVFASMPVVSESRFAALPVGAHSRHFTPLARRIVSIEFTRVVLPTPGPPVMITTRQVSAVWRASLWLGASVLPVLASHHCTAFSKSIGGYAGGASTNARIFAAMPSSAFLR
jgi:hypothetical protein